MNEAKTYYHDYWSNGGFVPCGENSFGLEQLFSRYLPKTGKVLDFGCGDGLTSGRLIARGPRKYVGVDVSDAAVLRAQENGFEATCIDETFRLPFGEGEFDAAVCIEVFEHLFLPHLAAKAILRVLKPGGCLLVTVPNAAHWRRRIELALLGLFDPYGDDRSRSEPWRDPHIRFFAPRTLERMLTSAGFENVSSWGNSTSPQKDLKGIRRAYWGMHNSNIYGKIELLCPSLLSFKVYAVGFKSSAACC